MRVQIIWLQCVAVCTVGLLSAGTAAAIATGNEMPSRVTLSGVPEEKVTLRSSTAPVTSISLN